MGEPNDELMDSLKIYSATKYAKTRSEVEKEIEARWATPAPEPPKDSSPSQEAPSAGSEAPQSGFLDAWLNKNK